MEFHNINSSSSAEILPDSPESSLGNVSTGGIPENSEDLEVVFENKNITETLNTLQPFDYRLDWW